MAPTAGGRTRTPRPATCAMLVAALWCLGVRTVDGFVAGGAAAGRLRSAGVGTVLAVTGRRARLVPRGGTGVRMAATDTDTWVRPPPRGKRDIVFGALVTASSPVAPKHDEGCGLGTYMQLPTDQYVLIPLPNNAKLEKKSDNLFSLRVPELQIFNVWLRPHVVSSVDVTPEGVIIEAVECRLDGSPEVQRLDLNSKFELSVKVVLQGYQDPRGLRSMLTCRSEISVWVDPPQMFRLMFPKPLMLETGNTVVRSSLRLLQSTFLKGLAADYNRWAVDETYRAQRAQAQK